MSRASFGGAADYSGLFASLYASVSSAEGGGGESLAAQAANLRYQYEAKTLDAAGYAAALRALAATGDQTTTNHYNLLTTAENVLQSVQAEADAKAKNEQAALDQDTADQWSNGLISDQAWLSYLAQRVASTTDPKERAKWSGYERKYSSQIGDNTAESAFKAGGSINDLVLYYQGKMGGLEPNTQEYRDASLRLSALQDQRSGTAIQDGAAALNSQIERGKATYADLVKFYRGQLGALRPGSDLAKQLEGEIVKVQDTIFQNDQSGKLEKLQYDYERGAITGRTFAKGIRTIAAQFQANDPAKYYQLLESAVKLDKKPGLIGSGGGSGSGSSTKAAAAKVDTLQAQRNGLLSLVQQADAGQKTGVDPVTGKSVTFSPQALANLDAQVLDTLEALGAAYDAKGDKSAAAVAKVDRMQYISGTVTKHNTANVQGYYADLVQSTSEVLKANAESATPSVSRVGLVAAAWQKFTQAIEFISKRVATTTVGGNTVFQTVQAGVRGPMDQVAPEFLARTKAMTAFLLVNASLTVTPEQKATAAAALSVAFGADEAFPDSPGSRDFKQVAESLMKPADDAQAMAAGLKDGTVMRLVVDGKVKFVNTKVPTPTEIAEGVGPQMADPRDPERAYIPGKDQKLTKIIMDIDGQPTVVSAIANKEQSSYQAWRVTAAGVKAFGKTLGVVVGQVLTEDLIVKLDAQFPNWSGNGSAEKKSVYEYYSVQVPAWSDDKGVHAPATWVQDIPTGQWYRDTLPIKGVQPRSDGTVRVVSGPNGPDYTIDYTPFAGAGGVPAPYGGSNPSKVGALIGAPGGISTVGLKDRDANGKVTDVLSAPTLFAYYDPSVSTYDPSLEMGDLQREKDWYRVQERKDRIQSAKTRALQAQLDATNAERVGRDLARQEPHPSAVPSPLDAVKSFATSLGLNFGTAKPAPLSAPVTPGLVGNLGRSGPAPLPTARVSAATGFTLNMPTVKAPTYSGPVLNLPPPVPVKSSAPKITTPTIVAGFTVPATKTPTKPLTQAASLALVR